MLQPCSRCHDRGLAAIRISPALCKAHFITGADLLQDMYSLEISATLSSAKHALMCAGGSRAL